MAKRELGAHALRVVRAVRTALERLDDAPAGAGAPEVIVGCSGGSDSLALALGTAWAAPRLGLRARAVIVDHGLQEGSGEVARRVGVLLESRGLAAEVRRVQIVASAGGPEAAAREARLEALARDGAPVLLGHTMDDQAETVLLGLLRGSGTRSLAGMASRRGLFLRPLLELRRTDTVAACAEWHVEAWRDPHNDEERFARVRARSEVAHLSEALGRDLVPALARTAALARQDADLLDGLTDDALQGVDLRAPLEVTLIAGWADALRLRAIRRWLGEAGLTEATMTQVLAVDDLVRRWRGQGPVALAGAVVVRRGTRLSIAMGGPESG
ncbi:MAG TPA: tRNA lysidine(34) synthetase TilS [Arachnia sp.]|nr:tRNA lysidine(34) synthetase TilS [Arachnia sp.]HMT85776.1 tRNA lysidine(34) synthetase TilS [Arachnia sp.]